MRHEAHVGPPPDPPQRISRPTAAVGDGRARRHIRAEVLGRLQFRAGAVRPAGHARCRRSSDAGARRRARLHSRCRGRHRSCGAGGRAQVEREAVEARHPGGRRTDFACRRARVHRRACETGTSARDRRDDHDGFGRSRPRPEQWCPQCGPPPGRRSCRVRGNRGVTQRPRTGRQARRRAARRRCGARGGHAR
jgi:hypothetical protein